MLSIPRLLAILGAAPTSDRLPIVVEVSPGEELALEIEARGEGVLLRVPDPDYDPVPLWRTRTSKKYWYTVLPDEGAVYFAYNSCAEDPAAPMQDFVTEVLDAVELTVAERLIIDLRNNSGGNSNVLSSQMKRIASHPRLAEPGRIIALIGPTTYSSGMMNAHQLREDTQATLVGEPTGGKPNSYGEVRSFRLPNSGLSVSYSVKYFRMLEEDPPSVEPDVLVELESGAHFAGKDPVLRKALKIEVGGAGK